MLIALKLLGSIALLIYGMKVMSEALQKMAGPQLRHMLGAMTTNRFTGVATGALVTVAVQSYERRLLLQRNVAGLAGFPGGYYPHPGREAPLCG